MSLYVTPGKFCLVQLIRIYQETLIPPSAHISVLSFIMSRIQPDVSRAHSKPESALRKHDLPVQDFESVLSPHAIGPNPWAMPEDTSVFRCWVRLVCEIASLDIMQAWMRNYDFFFPMRDQHGVLRSSPSIKPTSPLGIFVRRVTLEFQNLQYTDLMKLYNAFAVYRRPLAARRVELRLLDLPVPARQCPLRLYTTNTEDFSKGWAVEMEKSFLGHGSSRFMAVSTYDYEKLLEFQIEQMQKQGGRLPIEMRKQFEFLFRSKVPKTALAHHATYAHLCILASFLQAWCKGNYSTTMEYMHRYYDYSMQGRDRQNYQYALLQAAVVQADFGCYSEAIAAMNEAIATARENKDKVCLHYCLSWLHHFRASTQKELGDRTEHAILEPGVGGLVYLRKAARKDKLWGVEVAALLDEARLCMARGHSVKETRDRLTEASHLITQHGLVSYKAQMLLLKSALFAKLGLTALSTWHCNQALAVRGATQDDLVRGKCRLAFTLASSGKYKAAFAALDSVRSVASNNLRSQQYLAQCLGITKLKRLIHNSSTRHATQLIAQLKRTPVSDPALASALSLLEITHLARSHDLSAASTCLSTAFTICSSHAAPDVAHRIRLMTAKALLFARAGRPQKGFSICMRAVEAAKQSGCFHALYEAVGALAGVLVGLEQWVEALALVEGVLHKALETEDAALIAQLRSVGADALVGRAGAMGGDGTTDGESTEGAEGERAIAGLPTSETSPQIELLDQAETWLHLALKSYKVLEDYPGQIEVLRKLAVVARLTRDAEGAAGYEEMARGVGMVMFAS